MKDIKKADILQKLSDEEIESSNKQTYLLWTALLNRDLNLLKTILQEKFTYFDNKTKWQTLEYFKKQFAIQIPYELESEKVAVFYCKGCQPGNPALIFHNGYWPVLENSENFPKAIMLTFKNGLISDLTICYRFCKAEKLHEIAIQN